MGFGQAAAKHVPQAVSEKDPLGELAVGDNIGAFTGYLRRPKPSAEGMTAQFFGENGDDADIISAFHLSRYLDAIVKVTVWMIKDQDGRVMRKNGEYPQIATFIGSVRRPLPSKSGQIAQFFGGNGANSDSISRLNQTEFLDALVYVEIQKADRGLTVADISTEVALDELNSEAVRLTPKEVQVLQKEQKKASEGLRLLVVGGFFRQEIVLAALGAPQDYDNWIARQPCCHPGAAPCDQAPVEVFQLPQSTRPYSSVPFCREHAAQWSQGIQVIDPGMAPLGFLTSRRTALIQRWSQERLREVLGVPHGYDPTPSAIYSWAVNSKVHNLLPQAFQSLF